jgi:hypothetical protein
MRILWSLSAYKILCLVKVSNAQDSVKIIPPLGSCTEPAEFNLDSVSLRFFLALFFYLVPDVPRCMFASDFRT